MEFLGKDIQNENIIISLIAPSTSQVPHFNQTHLCSFIRALSDTFYIEQGTFLLTNNYNELI